jgi:hypothetical protein
MRVIITILLIVSWAEVTNLYRSSISHPVSIPEINRASQAGISVQNGYYRKRSLLGEQLGFPDNDENNGCGKFPQKSNCFHIPGENQIRGYQVAPPFPFSTSRAIRPEFPDYSGNLSEKEQGLHP